MLMLDRIRVYPGTLSLPQTAISDTFSFNPFPVTDLFSQFHQNGRGRSCVLAGINGHRAHLARLLKPAMRRHFRGIDGFHLKHTDMRPNTRNATSTNLHLSCTSENILKL